MRPTPTSDRIGAAIVGAGLMGRWHARAAARAGATIAVVVDPDTSAAAALSAEYPGSRTASVVEDVGGIASVAHVCSPVDTHAATARALLAAGLHVLVEKPIAATPVETNALLALATDARRLACPVHQFAFQRGVRKAVDATETVGPVLHFDFIICTAGAANPAAQASLIDTVLPHPLSLISVFLPGWLDRLEWQVLRPNSGELRAVSATRNTTVSIVLSTSGRPTANTLTLICERGTITIDLFHGFSIIEGGGVSKARKMARPILRSAATLTSAAENLAWRAVHRQSAFPGLNELTASFYDAIRTGGASPIPHSETLDVATARERILSTATG